MAVPTGTVCLTDLRTEFGDANGGNVCLTEYYAGGANVNSGTTNGSGTAIPSSGTLCLKSNFAGAQAAIHNTQFNVFYKSSQIYFGAGIYTRYSGMWYDYPVSTSTGMFGSMTTPTFTGNYAGYNGTHTIAQMQTINSDSSPSQTSFAFQIHNGTGGTSSQSGGTAYSSNSGLTGIRVYNNSSYTGTPLIDLTLASASATTNGWVGNFVNFNVAYYRARQWTWHVSASTYPQSTYFGTSTNTKYFQIY